MSKVNWTNLTWDEEQEMDKEFWEDVLVPREMSDKKTGNSLSISSLGLLQWLKTLSFGTIGE